MAGVLYQYLAKDHDRLEALLERAIANPVKIDMEAYSEFRKGLLRHIAIEEKIVLPAIARWQNGKKADIAGRLRLDHGAIAALLVPPPDTSVVVTLLSILAIHNQLEENEEGLYNLFETLGKSETEKMLEEMQAAPDVLVAPHNEQPEILEITKLAVLRAGYEFKSSG